VESEAESKVPGTAHRHDPHVHDVQAEPVTIVNPTAYALEPYHPGLHDPDCPPGRAALPRTLAAGSSDTKPAAT
jgi:hypothetical protein